MREGIEPQQELNVSDTLVRLREVLRDTRVITREIEHTLSDYLTGSNALHGVEEMKKIAPQGVSGFAADALEEAQESFLTLERILNIVRSKIGSACTDSSDRIPEYHEELVRK
jgi:hypothetical protein